MVGLIAVALHSAVALLQCKVQPPVQRRAAVAQFHLGLLINQTHPPTALSDNIHHIINVVGYSLIDDGEQRRAAVA
ncbi:hypothetical protein T484DRAFT_1964477 [Baffinella frigidus]|nr:hypothetical protein T484DRAFT_1964477 [Cryptophyta sp. CCMP2293]